jgi:hypothetical protein
LQSLSKRQDWLNLPWTNDEAAVVSAALRNFEGMQRALESALDARVTHHGVSLSLRAFLTNNAPLIMADISFKYVHLGPVLV